MKEIRKETKKEGRKERRKKKLKQDDEKRYKSIQNPETVKMGTWTNENSKRHGMKETEREKNKTRTERK